MYGLWGLLIHELISNEFTISTKWPFWNEEDEHDGLIHSTQYTPSNFHRHLSLLPLSVLGNLLKRANKTLLPIST